MEFDKSKVYTTLNADKSLIGAKGYFADSIFTLKTVVEHNFNADYQVLSDFENDCFKYNDNHIFNFFYLVEPAPEKPEKWYVNKHKDTGELTISEIEYSNSNWATHETLAKRTKEECEQWIEEHSKPKYRPFKDCDELISYFCHKHSISKTDWGMPFIWVKNKNHSEKYLIIAVTENCVVLYTNGQVFDMQELFEHYTFLDGSVCGVEEC